MEALDLRVGRSRCSSPSTRVTRETELATILYALTADRPAAAGRQVQAHRGRLIRSTGGSTVATFDSPVRALRCAAALREDASASGISVRAGVRAGEVEFAGEDIGGASGRVAAAVAGAARPAEILAWRIVKDLVVGSGIAFADRGTQRRAGTAEKWPLVAVTACSRLPARRHS